jgi:hypothetical protein
MKKFYLFLGLLLIGSASNSQLLTEPFNYTPDPSLGLSAQSQSGSNPWAIINTGDSILVDAGSLSYAGLAASTGNKVKFDGSGTDYYTNFTSQTSGSVYRSFILNVSALGTLNTTGGYFNGLIQSGSTSVFGAAVWSRLSSTAGKYNVGVSTRSNSAVTWLAADLTPGTPCFIVVAYDFNSGTGDDVSRIWLNTSAIGGAEPAADATSVVGTDLTSAARVFLRQDAATTTPFIEFDELRVGTTWASVTPGAAATPSLSASALTAFGNVCINTTPSPNSFTITGSNLTTANVTVGALSGYTYSTTSGGTYTTTLSLTQPGGTYSQQIFVKFTPTAVQSYNGNIPVGGGGATSVNVAASGAGINNAPGVVSGSASAITQTTATVAGTISSTGCTAITAYGIEYSTTAGFTPGTGTQVASSNLSGGNFTSNLGGLTSSTMYFYRAYATNSAGTTYGAELNFTTATPNPTLSATTLTGFGNVCVNTTTAANSFTISGSNLTTANVNVAALAGFTYSTTSGGTYTTTLSLTQPGGTYSQQIFVKFTPTAVQSYNGNIVVSGGGAPNINVAATGAGVNTAPTVTTGAASAITQNTATAAGTISATGCSAVSAYGIEYSLTSGFANGSGTQVASTNLSGGNFTSNLSGLTPSTTYYYKAYATNGGGTSWGAQQSFTTASPVLSATALTAFGNVCMNNTGGPNSFTITGVGVSTANITVGPLSGYTFATSAGGPYSPSLTLTHPAGAYTQQVFVNFTPTAVQSYNGNIPVSGGGATSINVAASGAGVNTTATVVTGGASNITTTSATLAGSIAANGCSNVTSYGIEYSGINGFLDGNGIKVPSSNLSGGGFNSTVTGLVQGTTYYYKAYAVNGGGISYGAQQSFTAASIANGFTFAPSPVSPGGQVRVTMNNLTPGYYGVLIFNSDGRQVYRKDINIQGTFINQMITIPGHLPGGIYRIQLINHLDVLSTKTILIL